MNGHEATISFFSHLPKRLENVLYGGTITDVCVTVHHIWKWREVPTWCNNYDLLS